MLFCPHKMHLISLRAHLQYSALSQYYSKVHSIHVKLSFCPTFVHLKWRYYKNSGSIFTQQYMVIISLPAGTFTLAYKYLAYFSKLCFTRGLHTLLH